MSHDILFFGGGSDERLVSVASAQNLANRHEFQELWYFSPSGEISKITRAELQSHARPFEIEFKPKSAPVAKSLAAAVENLRDACVFMGFHGDEGEDGRIQAFLEERRIPFTGSGSIASRDCFDKAKAKAIVGKSVRIARDLRLDARKPQIVREKLSEFFRTHGRIVVKPVASGSSFGLFIVMNAEDLEHAIEGVGSSRYGEFLVEEFIEGRELTVGVWDRGGQALALPASEVIMNQGRSFDYEGKYLGKGSTEITPAEISAEEMKAAQALAANVHGALGCYGYSRTDMILTGSGPVFIETNTLPGMTKASFFPQQLEAAKFEMSNFIRDQMDLAKRRF